MSHTPGPWHIEDRNEEGPLAVIGSDGLPVAFAFFPRDGSDYDANARLIAAAPALLAALQLTLIRLVECDEWLRDHEEYWGLDPAIASARAAIRAATGEGVEA